METLENIMTSEPKRIQRCRSKGWKMPQNAIYVGRPTIWGNPWTLGECYGDRTLTTHRYGRMLDEMPHEQLLDLIRPLVRHDLACWCRLDQPCHADHLLFALRMNFQ